MKSTQSDTGERHPHGAVRTEVVDEHVLVTTVDRIEKKRAFTSRITNELSDALTRLDEDDDLFVGVLGFAAAVQATADFHEGIASYVERRPAQFTGR